MSHALPVSVTIPMRTVSLSNQREHWGARARRSKAERDTVGWMVPKCAPPCVVTLTRISPRQLDDDNLRGSLKAVRDSVAERLGVDDRDPRVTWKYGQEKSREYAVRVEIEAVGLCKVAA